MKFIQNCNMFDPGLNYAEIATSEMHRGFCMIVLHLYGIFHFEISYVSMLSPTRTTLICVHFQGLISVD